LVTTRIPESGTSKWALVRLLGLPTGAEVRVDQKKVDGNAFSELLSTSEKAVTLYVKAKGFYDFQQQITLVAAQTQDIDVNLKPLPRLNEFPAVRKYVERLKNIPKGTFEMGSNRFKGSPIHMVTLDAFRLGETPVTVAMWKEYCKDTNVLMPPKPNWGWIDNHPVVNVSWNDIMGMDGKGGFCKWVSDVAGVKLTLPTEAQFEYASRAGKKGVVFPWGDKFEKGRSFNGWLLTGGVDRSYDIYRNGFGLTDMSGNVYQWCSDELPKATQVNPTGPTESSSGQRIARGGSWADKDAAVLLCVIRGGFDPAKQYPYFGFRLMAGPK
jgi:formylglycine-generating enzyme required for sulfatase activity